MRRLFQISSLLFLCLTTIFCSAKNFNDTAALLGRWDLTIYEGASLSAGWLEVDRSGYHQLVGRFLGTGGSARPVSRINFNGEQVSFSIPPQWEDGLGDLEFNGTLQGDSLTGIINFPDKKSFRFTAVHAPSLIREKKPSWGKPIHLLNANDLNGWHTSGTNQWTVEKGILRSAKSGSNIITDAVFTDFKLHIEFRYPKKGNSGVYLRGRYEVQIEDSGPNYPKSTRLGGVYGLLPANENAGKQPNEWQSYDITLVGRMITVVLNGKTIICNEEIPGITGGALDSKESEPGPLMLQGDHNPIEFRNIVITPAK